MEMTHVIHPFEPFFDENSRVLILGSFPSVKSRQEGFYYGHKNNRFWKLLSSLAEEEEPKSTEQKKAFLQHNGIALYDVIEECDIRGSSDASVRNAKVSDLGMILSSCSIEKIICNGRTAGDLYERYQREKTGREAVVLPSTSSANASFSLEKLKKMQKKN